MLECNIFKCDVYLTRKSFSQHGTPDEGRQNSRDPFDRQDDSLFLLLVKIIFFAPTQHASTAMLSHTQTTGK